MNARPDPQTLARRTLTLADDPAPQPVPQPRALPDMPQHDARVLTGRGGQAQIVLDGQVYTLRITRAGKLILTK